MKYSLAFILIFFSVIATAQTSIKPVIVLSPLAKYSSEWNKPVYAKCNTASNAVYMNKTEREVIYIINLARTYPQLFANTVLKEYPHYNNSTYYKSLMDTLLKLKPVNLLKPDKKCYISAASHATASGIKGFVGHERQTDESKKTRCFNGECIHYGRSQAVDIVVDLLIDEDVPSLGHRWICLSSYNGLGVAIKPHTSYGFNTVLDFIY